MKRPLTALALIGLALQAHAVDGVILIDQAKALAGGVTPGDTPGFPVTISQPGSYRLTSNLAVADMASNGIVITSPDVTLDLNGFELRGPNNCIGSGASLSCASFSLPVNSARGYGILVHTPEGAYAAALVHGGSVRGFASYGIRGLGGGYHAFTVERVRVSHSGHAGIGQAGMVSRSTVDSNGSQGIVSALAAVGNLVTRNRLQGIALSGVLHNASAYNGSANYQTSPLD